MTDAVGGVVEQWRRERPDIDPWPIGVVGRLMRLSRLWDKQIKDYLTENGLEPGEFDVLTVLRRRGEPYELTAGDILGASLVTSGAITLRIDRMEAKGLVERIRDSGDRRVVRVRLTRKGLSAIDKILPGHLANEAALLDGIDRETADRLADILSALLVARGDIG
ncbi:MarR family winged helix-turn-helix transcriptional regulator [Nocardia arthritidis]|uniref:MarR family transcriptional regulator n=1 Tax=Nocardia arthritidis TaxID=228602 RepID=A0A6G9YFA2_9NOCA|nr:MarR family transcriptional regulator [Nocardia arthritidis]QIS11901.1 MarR family transcriptional regulator [Nocardia arthritidis]